MSKRKNKLNAHIQCGWTLLLRFMVCAKMRDSVDSSGGGQS